MQKCVACAAEKDIPRLPSGWKRLQGQVYCAECWNSRYVLRAIVMPVVAPLGSDWQALNQALKPMFEQATQLSNWLMTELFARDVRRSPGVEKMPAMRYVYLYPEARERFPALPAVSVASLHQTVQRKYRARRLEVIWTCKSSLPNFRYPQPYPVPGQEWRPVIEDEVPIIELPIAGGRWRLRLKGGARFRRQLEAFRSLAAGESIHGELALYPSGSELMCKMIGWMKRKPLKERSGALYVRSLSEALLAGFDGNGKELWRFNADQMRRWSAEHRRQLQRWAQDSQVEPGASPSFAQRRALAVEKYHHRMNTLADQAAAYAIRYAERHNFKTIALDTSDPSFCPEFAWYRLKARMATLLGELGSELVLGEAEEASKLAMAKGQSS